MKKLTEQSEKNSPEEYDKIFLKRQELGPDDQDIRRWKKLLRYYKGGRLLDIGCLDSMVPQFAHDRFPRAEIWGMDLAKDSITQMRRLYPWAYFEVGDAYHTKFPSNYFGYVVAGELIEHLDRPKDFIEETMRILRPGGTLALSTPLDEASDPGAVDHERHIWSFTESDLVDMLEPYGSVIIKQLGSRFFPYYDYRFPSVLAYCKKHG